MALTVETGVGLPGADSYSSLEELDAWLASRGFTSWEDVSDADKETAAVRAADFMLQRYRRRWAGVRLTETQRLDWPRRYVPNKDVPNLYGSGPSYYPFDEVPALVKEAHALLTYKAHAGELNPDVSARVKRKKVEGLEIEYTDGGYTGSVEYTAIDGMLEPFFEGGDIAGRVWRA